MLLALILIMLQTNAPEKKDQQVVAPNDTIYVIGKITIQGNKVTKSSIIQREINLRVGDTVSQSSLTKNLLRDREKIYNLRLFVLVKVTHQVMEDKTLNIIVIVRERWYTFPVPIFSLSDRNFSEWWNTYKADFRRINYGITLYKYNFRGRNETVFLRAIFGFTSQFSLSYVMPYIDKKQRHGLTIEGSFSTQKNISYLTENHKILFAKSPQNLLTSYDIGLSYNFRKSFFRTHQVFVGFMGKRVADTVSRFLNQNYFGNSETTSLDYLSINYSFNSENRDIVAYPLHGSWFSTSIGNRGLGVYHRINLWELEASYSKHWQFLNKPIYLSNYSSFYLSYASSKPVPYAFYGGLGKGYQILRGFELSLIESPRFIINKTTLKYRIFSKEWYWEKFPMSQFRHYPLSIYWKIYSDVGYAQQYPYYAERNLNKILTNRLLASIGTGIDVVLLYDIVVRLECSFTNLSQQTLFINFRKEF